MALQVVLVLRECGSVDESVRAVQDVNVDVVLAECSNAVASVVCS